MDVVAGMWDGELNGLITRETLCGREADWKVIWMETCWDSLTEISDGELLEVFDGIFDWLLKGDWDGLFGGE
jgi:hypothetical protein